jgi:hypothetical protein
LARWGLFELSLGQGLNNLYIFAIEQKTQRKRGMFNLKYSIKSYVFYESELCLSLACLRWVPLNPLRSLYLRTPSGLPFSTAVSHSP